ncbi:MAG: hypothetical protein AB7U83_15745 [Vicinamibacterales bacterium]
MAVLLVALTSWSWVIPAFGSVPEPCPMAGESESGGPCVVAPCPCDHGRAATLVAPPSFVMPAASRSTMPPDSASACRPDSLRPLTAGFPPPIEHPPTARR